MTPTLPHRRVYHFESFELQLAARLLKRDGERVPIGSKAFEVLTCLVAHAGEVVSKEQLLKAVWPNSFVEESNLSQHVFALRKALGDRAGLIVTIPGRGYQFTGEVHEPEAIEGGLSPHREDAAVEAAHSPLGRDEVLVQTMRERAQVVFEERTRFLPQPVAEQRFRGWWLGLGIGLGLAAAVWGVSERMHHANASLVHTLMVADFQNTTGDATFDRALKRALEIDLAQSPSLSVMSAGEAVGALQTMGQKSDAALTGELAREVCIRGNRQILMNGGIASVGRAYLLTLEALDCSSGRKLASAKSQAGTKEQVLDALDTIADKVRGKLGESAQSIGSFQVPIAQATTTSLEALKAYSMGAYLTAQGKEETSYLGYYQRAVELDPKFAMAWGALANAYYNLNEFDLASENYKKAFELRGEATAKERLILEAHYYGEGLNDVVQAVRVYEMWAATYPLEWAPVVNICNGYSQIGQALAALPSCRRGLEMAPKSAIAHSVLIRALKDVGRFDEARQIGADAVAHGVDSAGVHASLFEMALIDGNAAELQREAKYTATSTDSWYAWTYPEMQGLKAAQAGRYAEAVPLLRTAEETAIRENLVESAQDVLQDQARIELELGLTAAAATLARLAKLDRDDADLALLRLQTGDTAVAERFVVAHERAERQGTLLQFVKLPLLRARLAMARGRAQEAIAELEPARPFELASFEVPSLRASAYLKARQPRAAAVEYEKVLANPGVDGTSPLYPLARLGLARAYAAAGDTARSREEYGKFLALWKDADATVPVLRAAKLESDRIR